ncbi:hypothetical protein HNP33_003138 [Comamonas odontotermitis]|uniref:IPTL-CTERM sorting domain-containing protein n=1 Tax=Comamonas odontotermitis TaxID=379895 RepID=A0ABR6RJ25_9BURK|nr:hypothetical protein [Comamonas odontotermitis]MBB6579028.1 hypothetical protein [Comamonas odontotermitis]
MTASLAYRCGTLATLRSQWAALGLLASASVFAPAAHAANVDLVTNIEPVTSNIPAQTFVPYRLNVSFSNINGTATNARASIELPANVTSVMLTAASGNAASCPAASAFSPVPTDNTAGGETMSATLPLMQNRQQCNYVLSVTPTKADSAYLMRSSMAAGSGDTETTPSTNTSENPFAVTQSEIKLAVDKKITAGASQDPNDATHWIGNAYNAPVEFTVTYTNKSATPVSLGAIASKWSDWEGSWSPQIVPSGSDGGLTSCASSVDGAGSAICNALSFSGASSQAGTNVNTFLNTDSTGFGKEVMQAGESITIKYWRSFKAPLCGSPALANTATWAVTAEDVHLQWDGSGSDSSTVSFSFPIALSTQGRDCTAVNLHENAEKKLLSVQDKAGVAKTSKVIDQDGDVAIYELTVDLSQDTAPPGSNRDGIDFNVYDTVLLAKGHMPMAAPVNALQLQMEWISCEDSNGNCIPANNPIQPYRAYFTPSFSQNVHVKWGSKAVMQIALRFKIDSNLQCMHHNDALQNQAAFSVVSVSTDGYTFGPSYIQSPSSANLADTQIEVLPNAPYCVNLTSNKRVTPMEVPDLATPVVFDLQFANNTAPDGPKSIRQAIAKDTLGPDFKATAASCSVSAGNATVPTGSLLGSIAVANNELQIPISNMERGAIVNCTITGNLLRSGSFKNVASVALQGSPAKALLNDGVTEVTAKDLTPEDNIATVNYMTADAVNPPVEPPTPPVPPTPPAPPTPPTTPAPVPANALWSVAGLAVAIAALARRRQKIR